MILLHYTGMQSGEAALQQPDHGCKQGFRPLRGIREWPHRSVRAGVTGAPGTPGIVVGRGNRHQFVFDRHRDRQSRRMNSAIPIFRCARLRPSSRCAKSIITGAGRSAPTASLRIPMSRPPASRIRARNFRGACLSRSGVGHWVRAAPLDLEGSGSSPATAATQ